MTPQAQNDLLPSIAPDQPLAFPWRLAWFFYLGGFVLLFIGGISTTYIGLQTPGHPFYPPFWLLTLLRIGFGSMVLGVALVALTSVIVIISGDEPMPIPLLSRLNSSCYD